jgi:Lecithin:cholesterol acyltransferase
MPTLYIVPGLGGSTLGFDPGGGRPVWVDYTRIALGNLGALRLAPDGISPGPPDGVQLYAGPPLADYYFNAALDLERQLKDQGYKVRLWGYDWRLSARISGPQLAALIAAEVLDADPCSIVAHSFGGLVSRVAWQTLKTQGKTGLIRRVVTLGSPHQGSYGVVALWSLDSDQLTQVRNLTLATSALLSLISPLIAPFPWTPTALVRLCATFPAFYETLPFLAGTYASGDPNRAALYGTTWPADRSISAAWQTYARTTWQTLMASPDTAIPSWVMTSVAGLNQSTPDTLRNPALLGGPQAYDHSPNGDNAVMELSALLADSAQVRVNARHADLPNQLAASGMLAQLVTAIRPPLTPPPAPTVITGAAVPLLAGPPVPSVLWPGLDP